MDPTVLDTDVASLLHRGTLAGPLATRLIGREPLIVHAADRRVAYTTDELSLSAVTVHLAAVNADRNVHPDDPQLVTAAIRELVSRCREAPR